MKLLRQGVADGDEQGCWERRRSNWNVVPYKMVVGSNEMTLMYFQQLKYL